jgi:ribosomal protein S27AE
MTEDKEFQSLKYMRVCPICGNTFISDKEHQYACKSCLTTSNPKHIKAMLEALERLGWSELIDGRWKDKVIQQIQMYFDGHIPMVDVYKLLEIVLW